MRIAAVVLPKIIPLAVNNNHHHRSIAGVNFSLLSLFPHYPEALP